MKKEEIINKLKEIVIDQFGKEKANINENTNIIEDLEADSLSNIELVMSIEDEFGIKIPNEDAIKFKTIGDVVKYIENVIK